MAIYTASEYSKTFRIGKKAVSSRTVRRCAKRGILPCGHKPRQLNGKRGPWVIDVKDK